MLKIIKKLIPHKVKLLLHSIFFSNSLNEGERIYWRGENPPPKGTTASAHWFLYNLALSYIKPDDIVLDAGCGSGFGSYIISKHASKVVGFDYSKKAINYCIKNNFNSNIKFIHSKVEKFDYLEKFDVILMIEFLEHNKDPKKILAQMYQFLLKKGGKIIISFPRELEGSPLVKCWHLYQFTDNRVKEVFSGYNYDIKGLKNISNADLKNLQEYDIKEATSFFIIIQK